MRLYIARLRKGRADPTTEPATIGRRMAMAEESRLRVRLSRDIMEALVGHDPSTGGRNALERSLGSSCEVISISEVWHGRRRTGSDLTFLTVAYPREGENTFETSLISALRRAFSDTGPSGESGFRAPGQRPGFAETGKIGFKDSIGARADTSPAPGALPV